MSNTDISPDQQVNNTDSSPADNIEAVIGKNTAYYLNEFKKVDGDQKTKFNWAAFLLGLFFCFYRKCTDLFKKYFLIPIGLLMVAAIAMAFAFTSFSLPMIAVGGILSTISSSWTFVNYIRFGKNFNKDYYEHCKTVLSEGDKKKYGTSIGSAMIVVAAVVVLSMIPSAISLLSILGDSTDSDDYGYLNNTLTFSESLLDGEYAIFEDATSNEFIYLNFNWAGPGTLQISYSEDPTETAEATYSILPTEDIIDGIDSYSLIISNDYVGENVEFLKFYAISDDIYYITPSESWAGEDGGSTTMVPRTEEFGFNLNATSTYSENTWPTNYSEYNLYNYQNTYISNNGYELQLIVLPSDTEFHANLNWSYSKQEGGVVYPGVSSQLDGGSTILLNLNKDGIVTTVEKR